MSVPTSKESGIRRASPKSSRTTSIMKRSLRSLRLFAQYNMTPAKGLAQRTTSGRIGLKAWCAGRNGGAYIMRMPIFLAIKGWRFG